MPVLTRCWQMLLKGLGEVQAAPSPLQAAEMALIRLTHAADLPPPGELARRLLEAGAAGSATPAAARRSAPPRRAPAPMSGPAPRASAADARRRRRRRRAGRRWRSRRARARRRP